MKKITRTINLILEIDWEDYEDVDEQLILEDAIREITDGVRISIASKNLVQPDVIKSDCTHKDRWVGKAVIEFCKNCEQALQIDKQTVL